MLSLDDIQNAIMNTPQNSPRQTHWGNFKEDIPNSGGKNEVGQNKLEIRHPDSATITRKKRTNSFGSQEKLFPLMSHSSKNSPESPKREEEKIHESSKSRERLKKITSAKKIDFLKEYNSATESDSNKDSKDESSPDNPKLSSRRRISNPDKGISFKKFANSLKSSSTTKKDLSNAFIETLPINKSTLNEYIKKAKSCLPKKEPYIFNCEDFPNLKLFIIAQDNTETGEKLTIKTMILINEHEIIGKGAASIVYKGYDLIYQKNWAIKITHTAARLRKIEVENLKARKWLNGCYNYPPNQHALIMKFIPGATLLKTLYTTDDSVSTNCINAKYCVSKKDLSIDLKFKLIRNLLKQLDKLHNKYNLLHRDLKPENIMVYFENDQLEKVRIIDLGDATAVNSKEEGVCGTKGYQDPQLEESPYSKASDIYSLGVIIAEILTKNNFQSLLRNELKKTIHLISPPLISFKQLKMCMDDVLSEEYEYDENYNNIIDTFIFMELKKLARKMLTYELLDLEKEISDLKKIKKYSAEVAPCINKIFESQTNLSMEVKLSFFNTVQDATTHYKSLCSSATKDTEYLNLQRSNV